VELAPDTDPANLQLTLRNLLGQPIPLRVVNGIHALECSADGLTSGIYLLEVLDKNSKKWEIRRIAIQ
ncbi:MAG: hypothetical protein EBX46_00645, partial [Burkholderiaceae bacterium]|nr:hypothetical protein [Burkholderiaceae bacterium]